VFIFAIQTLTNPNVVREGHRVDAQSRKSSVRTAPYHETRYQIRIAEEQRDDKV
jgi:hypothetical protein